MFVLGTAGHVDHGKSALVQRLTGIDPDRLAEEKRRGMTIDLGFAWLTLPTGNSVSIVDVPGHERFVKNMLAGAGGIDAALLVIAADEGVMPQTREHLAILDLLGISHGVVAITKADLVDDEWLELVCEETRALLGASGIEAPALVPVSVVTDRGITELITEIERLSRIPVSRAGSDLSLASLVGGDRRSGPVYMPIDRVFTSTGFGTVVTGTLHGAAIDVGDEVEFYPGGILARVRGLQVHREGVRSAAPRSRVAVNLAGVSRDEVRRGMVLGTPGELRAVKTFDARLLAHGPAHVPLRDGETLALHAGSAEVMASIGLFGKGEISPGEVGWARIRLREPIALTCRQRFVLRLPTPLGTVGGGIVADLDPRGRRRNQRRAIRLEGMLDSNVATNVRAVLSDGWPRDLSDIARLASLSSEEAEESVAMLVAREEAVILGECYIDRAGWERLRAETLTTLDVYHREHPLRRGMSREELRSKVRASKHLWNAVLQLLADEGKVVRSGSEISLSGVSGGLGGKRPDADRVLEVLRETPFSPPTGADLLERSGSDVTLLDVMVREGEIVRLADGVYMARDALDVLSQQILRMIDREGSVTVAGFRDAFDTSRKYALAVLEYLDGERVTRRVGDVRVAGSKRPACA